MAVTVLRQMAWRVASGKWHPICRLVGFFVVAICAGSYLLGADDPAWLRGL